MGREEDAAKLTFLRLWHIIKAQLKYVSGYTVETTKPGNKFEISDFLKRKLHRDIE